MKLFQMLLFTFMVSTFLFTKLAEGKAKKGSVYDPMGVKNGNSPWVTGLTYPSVVNLNVGDSMYFTWGQQHNVAIASGDCGCSCSSTQLLSSTSPYIWKATKPGDYTILCTIAGHCAEGQVVHVNVAAKKHSG
jgi:plastocyanin